MIKVFLSLQEEIMILLLFVLVFTETKCINRSSVGTTLFTNEHSSRKCWREDEIAKLRARKMFEDLIPSPVTPDKINTKYVKDTLRYYQQALRTVENDPHNAFLLREALADTIGAHFRSEVLPTVRFAYYAGYVPYRKVRQLHNFWEDLKVYLNTQGIGWKRPTRNFQWSNMTVVKIVTGYGRFLDPCACMITKRDMNSCIHIPSPLLDDKKSPSAIAMPFKSGGLVGLTTANSENILLKYYTTACRCILRSSPEKCRHSDFVNFNNELWHWMKRDLAPHLMDEKLYTAFGGALRVAAAVQSYGKGLSRRNLLDYGDAAGVTKWHPWRTLANSYVYINADWSPQLYVGVVLLAAAVICGLQMCYNYVFGDATGCNCKELSSSRSNRAQSKSVNYVTVEGPPAVLSPNRNSGDGRKSASPGSGRTQRVYDLNDNTETLMDVIVSEDEGGDSAPSRDSSEGAPEKHIIDVGPAARSKSPPTIDSDVAHLTIERAGSRRAAESRTTVYTTSATTEATYKPRPLDSAWSESGSSTSVLSGSSDTSGARGLTWARRVASQASRGAHPARSTSGTEHDIYSLTTPPSRRQYK